MVHLQWCCRLYLKQIERGTYFLHEHPSGASSWDERCVREVMAKISVRRVVADQCQLGQRTDAGDPIKKPTGFMSNSHELLEVLNVRCFGKHGLCSRPRGGAHVPCQGMVARRAAIFQDELCEAILRGLRNQMIADRRARAGEVGIHAVMLDGREDIEEFEKAKQTPGPSGFDTGSPVVIDDDRLHNGRRTVVFLCDHKKAVLSHRSETQDNDQHATQFLNTRNTQSVSA